MPTDDEFRRVAEDVRALVRSLARDVRGAIDRAREDTGHHPPAHGLSAAGRIARDEVRLARDAFRQSGLNRRHHHHHLRHGGGGPWWFERPAIGNQPDREPRWDGCGRRDRQDRQARPNALVPATGSGIDGNADLTAPVRYRRPGPVPGTGRRSRPVPPPPLPLRHRHDGSTLLGLLALVFGLAWLAAGSHVVQVSAQGVLAVALMVLGVTMVVTARTDWALSRRRWPLMAGGALVVALVVSSASPTLGGGLRDLQIGSRTVAPASWPEAPTHIQGGIGRTVVNLSALTARPPAGQALTVDGSVGILVIELPPGLTALLDGHIGVGNVRFNGFNLASGFRQSYHQLLRGGATTEPPSLTLHVNAGVGTVEISNQAAPTDSPVPTGPPAPTVPPLPTEPGPK